MGFGLVFSSQVGCELVSVLVSVVCEETLSPWQASARRILIAPGAMHSRRVTLWPSLFVVVSLVICRLSGANDLGLSNVLCCGWVLAVHSLVCVRLVIGRVL